MIITLTGPSCAGKTTLEEMLRQRGCVKAISTTTRPIRKGEVNGESYYFMSKDEFRANVIFGKFVEHVEFDGNSYGLATFEVKRLMAQDKTIVVVCEPHGAAQVAEFCGANSIPLLSVFISASPEVIGERFLSRFAGELEVDRVGYTNQLVDTYARRMASMMTVEREWVEGAKDGSAAYDMIVSRFDESTSESVVQSILTRVERAKEAA